MSRLEPRRTRNPLLHASRAYAKRRFGKEPNMVGVQAHHMPLFLAYGTFEIAIDRARRVDRRLKDLAVVKTAAMVGCEWCMDYGSHVLEEAGVTEEQLRDLASFRDSAAFSADEKLVLEYAEAMGRTPAEVTDELFARLRARFEPDQIVELTTTIAIENYRARFNDALGIEAQGWSAGSYCVRPEVMASTGG